MTLTEQRDAARAIGNERRTRAQALRRQLRSGTLSLDAVMSEPPEALSSYPLIDVIRSTRCSGPRRALVMIGRQAVIDGVNLMVPLGEASPRSRAWAAEWGTYWQPRREVSA